MTEGMELQIARSCVLGDALREALLAEAQRCGWENADDFEAFRDWTYAYLGF